MAYGRPPEGARRCRLRWLSPDRDVPAIQGKRGRDAEAVGSPCRHGGALRERHCCRKSVSLLVSVTDVIESYTTTTIPGSSILSDSQRELQN